MEDQQDEVIPMFHKTQIWPEISEDSGYKYKLSALLFIRGIQTHWKFLLASHIDKLNVECTNSEGDQGLVESFNDIIFIEESQGGVKSCSFVLVKCTATEFVVKHSDLISTQGSFSLHSLFVSYLRIKSLFDSGELDYMQVTFENCKFILYTNALFAFQEQNVSVLAENIFSTNDSGFVLAKGCKLISENSVVGIDFQSFIEKLQFFHSQANENKLDRLLYKHFSRLDLQPESLVELFHKQFMQNFQNWWKEMGECFFLTEKSSLLDKVISDYILFLNSKKQKEVDVIRIKFTEETIQQLQENITNAQCHIETVGKGSMLVSMYKVRHVLRFLGQFKWYIFVGSKEAHDLRLQLMSIWKSHYCSFLGIVVELDINLEEFIELIILIRDVLQNQHSKRVVFLIKETIEYAEINTTLRKYLDL